MNNDPSFLPPTPVATGRKTTLAWVLALLFIFLAAAFMFFRWPDLKNFFKNNNPGPLTESPKSLESFYYVTDNSREQETQFSIFKVTPTLEESDTKTHSFTIPGHYTPIITDSWKKNMVLFISNSEAQATIYSLDVSAKNSQPAILLTIPLDKNNSESVGDVRFVDGGTALALIIANSKNDRAENSYLKIVDPKDQNKKESYLLNERSPLYAGFRFLEASPDSKIIYLHETGGDGGAIWSKWYKVSRTPKTVQKLEGLPPLSKVDGNPTLAVFSPDRSQLAYADFSAVIDVSDIDSQSSTFGSCLKYWNSNAMQKYESEGGTVMIRNMTTGTVDEVFRNLAYSDNVCKNLARRIISLKWLDDSRLVFETVDGVYTLNVLTKEKQALFIFERTYSPGQENRPYVLSIQLPYIVFSDRSIVQINSSKLIKSVTTESQRGYFFSF